jgi:tetratricopeptide (TPR) repeat protein
MPSLPFTQLDSPLAAPRESHTANPAFFETGISSLTPDDAAQAVSAVELHVRTAPFRGRKILDPREAEAHQFLEAERAGLVNQAQANVDAAPQSAVAWARLAQTLISLGKAEEAVHAAKAAIARSSGSSGTIDNDQIVNNTARFVAARILATTDNGSEAEKALENLPRSGPWTLLNAALAERNGHYHEAISRLGDDNSNSALAFRGYLLLKLNQADAALRQLRAAARAGKANPSLLLNLAYAYAMIGASSKAIRSAKQAVFLSPRDRNVSFNLVSYLRAAGRLDEAIAELRRLQSVCGAADPEVAAVTADVYAACGDVRRALRELRRAWHHNELNERSTVLAQLAANIALLEWKQGDRTRESAADVIRTQIKRADTDPQLAFMLADISKTSWVSELRTLYDSLLPQARERDLAPLKIQILLRSGELEDAAKDAISLMNDYPLGANYASGAIVLYAHIFGEYESASEAGKKALRRIPADCTLINNVAFCLTLSGRAGEAWKVLAKADTENPYLLATRGLIDLGLGNVRRGLARYDEAAEFATARTRRPQDASDFQKLLRTQECLAIHQLGLNLHPDIPEDLTVARVPEDWREYPVYLVLNRVAQRLNVPWISEDSESP